MCDELHLQLHRAYRVSLRKYYAVPNAEMNDKYKRLMTREGALECPKGLLSMAQQRLQYLRRSSEEITTNRKRKRKGGTAKGLGTCVHCFENTVSGGTDVSPVLVCRGEGCEATTHLKCSGVSRTTVPSSIWFCSRPCEVNTILEDTCIYCKNPTEREGEEERDGLLAFVCDLNCGRETHMECARLASAEDDWRCGYCADENNATERPASGRREASRNNKNKKRRR